MRDKILEVVFQCVRCSVYNVDHLSMAEQDFSDLSIAIFATRWKIKSNWPYHHFKFLILSKIIFRWEHGIKHISFFLTRLVKMTPQLCFLVALLWILQKSTRDLLCTWDRVRCSVIRIGTECDWKLYILNIYLKKINISYHFCHSFFCLLFYFIQNEMVCRIKRQKPTSGPQLWHSAS